MLCEDSSYTELCYINGKQDYICQVNFNHELFQTLDENLFSTTQSNFQDYVEEFYFRVDFHVYVNWLSHGRWGNSTGMYKLGSYFTVTLFIGCTIIVSTKKYMYINHTQCCGNCWHVTWLSSRNATSTLRLSGDWLVKPCSYVVWGKISLLSYTCW